jgi:hypothetical protein
MAQIPIIDGKSNLVARVEWTGGIFRGKGTVKSTRAKAEQAKRIREMIAQRQDLARVNFRARTESGVIKGWKGFEGTLQALNMSLPSIGYFVDWDHVEWPSNADKFEGERVEL